MNGLKWLGRGLAALAVLLVVTALGGMVWRAVLQHQTAQARTPIDKNIGVDEFYKVQIGGIDQWVRVRGADRRSPVLLYLHGGPGTPMIPFAHVFQNEWEKHFIVVQWDQRGAGKTRFASNAAEVDKTIDFPRMEADAHELTQFLKAKYDKPKIFLLGHSWGSMLGISLIRDFPHDYFAYVGTGQVVRMQDNEKLGYDFTLKTAEARRNQEALSELRAIAPYPRPDGSHLDKDIWVLRKWETAFGIGVSHRYRDNMDLTMLKFALTSPDYTLRDIGYFLGEHDWPALQRELNSFDIVRYGARFEVPVILIEGRHDWQTPSVLAERWIAGVSAPEKKYFWLEHSAHSPMVDEPDAFTRVLVDEVLPYAGPTRPKSQQ